MYALEFTNLAKKQFLKLPRDVQLRIKKSLLRIKIRPESFLKRLVGQKIYSLRVGDYRLLLDLNKNKLIVLVLKIGHRKNVYR